MSQYSFLSVLSSATATGSISLNVLSVGACGTDVSLTIQCTGITIGDSPITVAKKCYTSLVATLSANSNQYWFNSPVYGNQIPSAKWRPSWTEHVTSLYSQCQYLATVVTNTTGATLHLDEHPLLLTLYDADDYGTLIGQTWLDDNGNAYTTTQKIALINMACDLWTSITNNNVVQACYVHEEEGFCTNAIRMGKLPLTSLDTPRVRRPSPLASLVADSTTSEVLSLYTIDRTTGWVEFKFTQNLLFNWEPFDFFNEIKISYIAGNFTISNQVKISILELSKFIGTSLGSAGVIKSFATGTFKTELRSRGELYREIFSSLSSYFLPVNA